MPLVRELPYQGLWVIIKKNNGLPQNSLTFADNLIFNEQISLYCKNQQFDILHELLVMLNYLICLL